MAMEANTYESHDSVQALADVGLTLALSKGRGNANMVKSEQAHPLGDGKNPFTGGQK